MKKQDVRNGILLFAIAFVLMAVSNFTIDLPVTNDEVSTLANDAYLLDLDWRPFIQSSGNYYFKYAQALLYYPFFLLFHDTETLLHVLLTWNSLFAALIAPICYAICRRHLNIANTKRAFGLALTAGLTPAPLLYAGYARADIAIIVTPWLVVLSLLEGNRASDQSKRNFVFWSLGAALFSVFSFMSHSRGVVLIIATAMVVFFARFFLKRKLVSLPVYVVLSGILLVADRFLTRFFKSAVWTNGFRGASLEGFNFRELMKIFTPQGFVNFIRLLIGWTYNMFTSTFGLSALGLLAAFLLFLCIFRKKDRLTDSQSVLVLFLLLLFLGTLAMSALFFFRPVNLFYTGEKLSRGDRLIFDRYMSGTLPFLCFIGLYGLLEKENAVGKKTVIFSVFLQLAVLFLFARFVAGRLDNYSVDRKYFIALNLFVPLKKGETVITLSNLSDILVYTGIFAAAVFSFLMTLLGAGWKRTMFLCIAAAFLVNYGVCFYKAKYLVANKYNRAVEPAASLLNSFGDLYEEYPNVMKDSGVNGGKSWQYALPNYDVISTKYYKNQDLDDVIIISNEVPFKTTWYDDDYYMFPDIDYKKAKNKPYIKGEDLNRELNERGIETVKVTEDMLNEAG